LPNCLKKIFLAFWQTAFEQISWLFGKLPLNKLAGILANCLKCNSQHFKSATGMTIAGTLKKCR
jgi:hypothetical protein